MSNTVASLRRKIATASELETVVRIMKSMAASSISQYEDAVRALQDYERSVQLGLAACFRQAPPAVAGKSQSEVVTGAVVFGTDQGLVGQFNDLLVDFVVAALDKLPGPKILWAVGERLQSRLAESALGNARSLPLPNSIGAISGLVGAVLLEIETRRERGELSQVYLFHNRPQAGAIYQPFSQRLVPLDAGWQRALAARKWPTNNLPEAIPGGAASLLAFVREYLFVSLFRACAESLASENASRLAAMQRAEKNIGERLAGLGADFHRLRQAAIDEELFDLVSGFEADAR